MAKPGTDRDGAMVEKTTGKKKISPFTKTPKLDRSEIMGKPKSSMKRKLSFSVSSPCNEERDSDTDTTPSQPSQASAVQKKTPNSSTSRQKDKVNKRNMHGETPLHMAAFRGDVKQVKELIGLGADVNMKDFAGWTPLHVACNYGYYDVAKVLIGAGAEVNTQGLDDDTPLHDASSSGHKDIVKLLLQHGGNAFQGNKRGERPVDVADSQEVEQLLKVEIPLSDPVDSSSNLHYIAKDSEDPLSVNPSSVDENMEYSDTEKDSAGKSTTAKTTSLVSGLDEYEIKDEEEEEYLTNAQNYRHILRREARQKEKEEKEQNHDTPKQSNKSDKTTSSCKLKKPKSSRVLYCSSDSSDNEMAAPSERKCSPTRSHCNETHKTESRTKRESLILLASEKGNKNKNKSQSKNKVNKEFQEDGKENSKSLLFSTATVSDNSDKIVQEEDSFKMSSSPEDNSSVHLFHLSAVKSPKLNYNQTDKQMTPLKQENAETYVSIGDGSCPMDSVKYNHYTDSEYTEGSSSESCKHKDKSKHHYKEHSLEGDDRSSSPFKDASLSNSMDGSAGAFRKADKDGKVVKKHKLKHKENDKYRKDYESERNRHRQKELRKDGHRNMEFVNFFKSDENEELKGKCETPGSCSPHEENKKSMDKLDRRSEKEEHKKEHSSSDHKDKDKMSSEKKSKAPEKNSDHSKIDQIKEKEREKDKDSDKKKKEKSKEVTLPSSSSNLKFLLEEKKGYIPESNKIVTSKFREEVGKTPEKDRDRRETDQNLERHRDRERHKEKDKDNERSQQSRDSKLSKARPVESESDRSKSKASPVQKETRPKEKRLGNNDLMQTSFERTLSLMDQEIEQWHKQHLEKIKQNARKRLKQRPGADTGKQKNKDKARISTSSESNKELLRSTGSEIPEKLPVKPML